MYLSAYHRPFDIKNQKIGTNLGDKERFYRWVPGILPVFWPSYDLSYKGDFETRFGSERFRPMAKHE